MNNYRTEYREKDDGVWTSWMRWDTFPCSPDGPNDAAVNAYFSALGADLKARLRIREDGDVREYRLKPVR